MATSATQLSHAAIEKRILELCALKDGVTTDVIKNDMPTADLMTLVKILNKLSSKGRLEFHTRPDKTVIYKLRDPVNQKVLRGADKEEQVVYDIVQRSGASGIWVRKIKMESQLHFNTIEKVLKRLENKKLIKSVNSVQAPKKKFYLLGNLEPDRSLTGGPFYNETQFDSEYVQILMETCYKYLENKRKTAEAESPKDNPLAALNASKVTVKEMKEYIDQLQLSKIKLDTEDIEKLLDTLVYDGSVVCQASGYNDGSSVKLWRAIPDWAPKPTMLKNPCGVCPLIEKCHDVGDITPYSCKYLEEWLTE